MEDMYNSIVLFIQGLDSIVKVLIVGIFTILALLCLKNVVTAFYDAKKFKFKLMPILLTLLFGFLAVFVATA